LSSCSRVFQLGSRRAIQRLKFMIYCIGWVELAGYIFSLFLLLYLT
jgi:hypothetical protein